MSTPGESGGGTDINGSNNDQETKAVVAGATDPAKSSKRYFSMLVYRGRNGRIWWGLSG